MRAVAGRAVGAVLRLPQRSFERNTYVQLNCRSICLKRWLEVGRSALAHRVPAKTMFLSLVVVVGGNRPLLGRAFGGHSGGIRHNAPFLVPENTVFQSQEEEHLPHATHLFKILKGSTGAADRRSGGLGGHLF